MSKTEQTSLFIEKNRQEGEKNDNNIPLNGKSEKKIINLKINTGSPKIINFFNESYHQPKKLIIRKKDNVMLFNDNRGELDILDTRNINSQEYVNEKRNRNVIMENIPERITGSYNEDYNIIYIDDIIRKKLIQETVTLVPYLNNKYQILQNQIQQPQKILQRTNTLEKMALLKKNIEEITTGQKLQTYNDKVGKIIQEYRKYSSNIKTVLFTIDETNNKYEELNDETRHRLSIIDNFLDVARNYIEIDIIRINNKPADICTACGSCLLKVAPNEYGTLCCPNENCQTEHNIIIMTKLAKDGSRINTINTNGDDSIDNFIRALNRYQGLQPVHPDASLYLELDEFFAQYNIPSGDIIKTLPLDAHGRRGDTSHRMLWNALYSINHSEYYEDVNLIGHIYWGWTLPDVSHYREIIIAHYNKTQKVFYQIPPEQRGRDSSLGTQYRLWRHLELVGHKCFREEFKIAENPESFRTHNKLWRLMCEGAHDPSIYYVS